jgi:serine/threonine protein kinase
MSMALTPGTRLGPYEISALLGVGGMGEVYRALDTRLGRTVALKVLPSEATADPDRRQSFEEEARTVAALNHPNICVLYDIGQATIPNLAWPPRQSPAEGLDTAGDGQAEAGASAGATVTVDFLSWSTSTASRSPNGWRAARCRSSRRSTWPFRCPMRSTRRTATAWCTATSRRPT